MPMIELTEEEMELIGMALQYSVEDFKGYAENHPEGMDEEAKTDAEFGMKFMDLRSKFPDPERPIQLNE